MRQEDGKSLSDQETMRVDHAKSSGESKRLEADARDGSVDIVWIKNATRLARDHIDSLVMWRSLEANGASRNAGTT